MSNLFILGNPSLKRGNFYDRLCVRFDPAIDVAEKNFRAATADCPESKRETLGIRFCDKSHDS